MHEPAPIHPTSHVGVSSEEAARILGVSLTTIRRWIREGKLQAERVSRPQGYLLQVAVPAEAVLAATPAPPADDHAPRRLHVATAPAKDAEQVSSEPAHLQPRAHQTGDLVGLVERQQTTIMELAGRVGYLQAELAASREQVRALTAPQEEPTRDPWWRRWFAP